MIPIHARRDCYDAATYQTDSRASMYCKFTKKEFRYGQKKTQPALHLSKKNSDFSLPITCYFYFDCYTGHEAPGQSHHTVRSTLFLKCYSRSRKGRSTFYATQFIDVSRQFSKLFLFPVSVFVFCFVRLRDAISHGPKVCKDWLSAL
jgi:hypothetical protein